MSLRNVAVALATVTVLTGCGFEPIAAVPTTVGEQDLKVSSLSISSSSREYDYRLRRELLKSIEIDESVGSSLSLMSAISSDGLAIEQDDTVTRQNFSVITSYSLSFDPIDPEDPDSAPPSVEGTTRAVTSANTTDSVFASDVASDEARNRLAIETARRIVTILRLNRLRGDGA